jgi:ankyrin repeat protein
MDALADCMTVGEIEQALKTLPQQINETYDQAMSRIAKLSTNRQRAVKRLLLWISYARHPLTTREIEHATAVSRGIREIEAEHVLSARVLTSLTAGLVIIDENENVRLTHKTAEDYFSQKREILFPTGDIELAECCLAYLQLAEFEAGPCSAPSESDAFNARLKEYPLLGYAAMNWGYHARRSNSPIVVPQALMFLRSKECLEASVQALWYTDTESQYSWDVTGGVDPLHVAAWFGLNDTVLGLLAEGADPDALDSQGTTPLIYACLNRHLDVASSLLDAGASARVIDGRGYTALHHCVQLRQLELTRRLLQEKDVAVNALCSSLDNFTALIMACWNKDSDLVGLLLSRSDIDVNLASPTARWNPLLLAAINDDEKTIGLLLQHPEIDRNYRDWSGYTAFHHAASGGYTLSLEALFQGGVDPNVGDRQNGKPLQRAIDDDELAAVQILLKHGVEWNFKDTLGRTVFHAAAVNDRSQILRLLLQTCKDVDIDSQGDNGETPLHDAAQRGYLETVKVLLEFGARTDILNKGGRTPVRAAKDAGKTGLLDVLREARDKEFALDHKHEAHLMRHQDTFATKIEQSLTTVVQQSDLETLRARIIRTNVDEINAHTHDFNYTPLHVACDYRTVEFVQVLLDAGAFVDPMDAFHRTPLTIACQGGDPDIVLALIKAGADVNTSKFNGRPPWEIALKNGGSKAAVILLAQPQTEIDSTSALLARAIGWAAALGDMDACRRLVDAGAPIHLKNANGLTPMQVANGWEQESVEKFLVEAAAKQRAASSPKLPSIDTFTNEKTVAGVPQDNGVGHPPRRSPTSKKEFMELMKPVSTKNENSLQETSQQLAKRDAALSFSSPRALAVMIGLLAVLLMSVWYR